MIQTGRSALGREVYENRNSPPASTPVDGSALADNIRLLPLSSGQEYARQLVALNCMLPPLSGLQAPQVAVKGQQPAAVAVPESIPDSEPLCGRVEAFHHISAAVEVPDRAPAADQPDALLADLNLLRPLPVARHHNLPPAAAGITRESDVPEALGEDQERSPLGLTEDEGARESVEIEPFCFTEIEPFCFTPGGDAAVAGGK